MPHQNQPIDFGGFPPDTPVVVTTDQLTEITNIQGTRGNRRYRSQNALDLTRFELLKQLVPSLQISDRITEFLLIAALTAGSSIISYEWVFPAMGPQLQALLAIVLAISAFGAFHLRQWIAQLLGGIEPVMFYRSCAIACGVAFAFFMDWGAS